MQSIDSIETYAYGTDKDLVSENEEVKCDNIIQNVIHFDDFTNDHLYQILIIRGSGSVEINLLFNLIVHQPDIDKIHLYAKVPYEAKYQFLISKLDSTGPNHFKDFKAFTE